MVLKQLTDFLEKNCNNQFIFKLDIIRRENDLLIIKNPDIEEIHITKEGLTYKVCYIENDDEQIIYLDQKEEIVDFLFTYL